MDQRLKNTKVKNPQKKKKTTKNPRQQPLKQQQNINQRPTQNNQLIKQINQYQYDTVISNNQLIMKQHNSTQDQLQDKLKHTTNQDIQFLEARNWSKSALVEQIKKNPFIHEQQDLSEDQDQLKDEFADSYDLVGLQTFYSDQKHNDYKNKHQITSDIMSQQEKIDNRLFWQYQQKRLSTNIKKLKNDKERKLEFNNYLLQQQYQKIDIDKLYDYIKKEKLQVHQTILSVSTPFQLSQKDFFLNEQKKLAITDQQYTSLESNKVLMEEFYQQSQKLQDQLSSNLQSIQQLLEHIDYKQPLKQYNESIQQKLNSILIQQQQSIQINVQTQIKIQQILAQQYYPIQYMKEYCQQQLNTSLVQELNKKKEYNEIIENQNQYNNHKYKSDDSQQDQFMQLLNINKRSENYQLRQRATKINPDLNQDSNDKYKNSFRKNQQQDQNLQQQIIQDNFQELQLDINVKQSMIPQLQQQFQNQPHPLLQQQQLIPLLQQQLQQDPYQQIQQYGQMPQLQQNLQNQPLAQIQQQVLIPQLQGQAQQYHPPQFEQQVYIPLLQQQPQQNHHPQPEQQQNIPQLQEQPQNNDNPQVEQQILLIPQLPDAQQDQQQQMERNKQFLSINKVTVMNFGSLLTYQTFNWQLVDKHSFATGRSILIITDQRNLDTVKQWMFQKTSLYLKQYLILKFEQDLTFIYINTHKDSNISRYEHLQPLSLQTLCYIRSPTKDDIINIAKYCQVIENVQLTFNKDYNYEINNIPSLYNQLKFTCNNIMFQYALGDNDNDYQPFVDYVKQINITHTNNNSAKDKSFILQMNRTIYLYIVLDEEITTVGYHGYKKILHYELERAFTIKKDIQRDLNQILKVITRNKDKSLYKLLDQIRKFKKEQDKFQQYGQLNDMIDISIYNQPLQQQNLNPQQEQQ